MLHTSAVRKPIETQFVKHHFACDVASMLSESSDVHRAISQSLSFQR